MTFATVRKYRKYPVALTTLLVLAMVALLAILANTVFATDAPTVPSLSVSPEAVKSNSTTNFTLTVTNTSGDAIEKVVIDVPPAGTGGSNFNVTSAPAPTGWTLDSTASDQFGSRTDTLTYTVTTDSLKTTLTEGVEWAQGGDNDASALALADAIDGVAGLSAQETTDGSGNLTVTADAFGAGGNDIILESPDDTTNIALAGGGALQPLTGGTAEVKASLVVTSLVAGNAGDALEITVPSPARIRNAVVAASNVLTLGADAADTETVVIDGKTYTFQATLTDVDGNVLIAGNASDSIDNLIAAITLGSGSGTDYAASTTVHPTVTAAAGAGDTMVATALTAGTAANAIATTETLTGDWTDATLSGGVDNAVGFTATADGPTLTATYTWTATATDVGDDSVLGTGSDDTVVAATDTVVVENTVPTVSTITVNDSSGDGDVDEVVIVFDGNMDDSTFDETEWSVGGQTPSATLKSDGANDDDWTLDLSSSTLTGTGVFDVTYTGTTAADAAGNLLAAVATGDVTEVDNAVPVVKTIETGDADADGKIDRIVITASEALATGGSPDDGWAVVGFTITSGAISGSVLTLTITELGSADTSLKPDTTFDGSGDLKDLAATPLQMASVGSGIGELDKAPPVLLSAQTKTSTTIDATFSETVATAAAGDFSVAGSTVSGASASGAVVTITVDAAFNTGATPLVTYTAGTLVDTAPAPNIAVSGTVTPTDASKPSLFSVTWTDTDTSGTINATDTLKLVFSEAMDETTVAAADIDTDLDADFPTSGSGSPTYGTVANGTSILWTVGGTVLTITLGTDAVDLEAGDTVDPLDSGVLDLAGNLDNTTSAPAIVQVTLSLVPDVTSVVKNGNVVVAVEISNVLSFDAAVYTVQFNDKRFEFVTAAAGSIGGTPILVSASNTTTTTVLLSQNVSGNAGVNGSGTLAVLTFKYVGNSGENDTLIFASNSVTLSNANANAISANLVDAPAISSPALLGDANGDGSLGAADITAIELLVIGLDVNGVISGEIPPGADADSSGLPLDALDVTKVEDLVINAP